LLGHWVEPIEIAELLESGILPKLVIVSLIAHIDRFEGHSLRVLGLQIIREVPVQNIGKYRLGLLGVVGVEGHTGDHQAVFEEENAHFAHVFEAFDAGANRGEALLFSDEIQLLDTAGEHLSVDLTRQVVSILRSLMFQLFANTSCIEFTFTLTSFATDPFETVVGEELGHLGNLCFVVITLNREVGNLVNTVLTCRHR